MAQTLAETRFETPRATVIDRVLSIFSKVQAGEGAGVLLLASNIFLLLGTYYILKTIREPLILSQPGGAEVKSYASAAQTLLFLIAVPLYGMIASRLNRMLLIAAVTGFFVLNLAIFSALGQARFDIGIAFFIWVGVFNMLVVAQFWGFANDLYTEEQGKRLFPIAGVGASLGAWLGALLSKWLFRYFGPYELMGIAAVLLAGCVGLTWLIHTRESRRASAPRALQASQPLDRKGGFQLIAKETYLLQIALLVLLLNLVNSNGEYIVSRFVSESARALPKGEQGKFIGQFYGDYFSWVNLLGLIIQTFLVSRIFRWIGVGGALFILPVIALCGYSFLAFAPVLSIIRGTKILENSTDYSLNNTVRHALFLPTSREAKYKAKAATDTFFVRGGDVISAACVFAGVNWFSFTVGNCAMLNVLLVGVWLVLAFLLKRRYQSMTAAV